MSFYLSLVDQWRQPEHIAVRAADTAVSYRELDARARRAAGWLASRGVRRGDVVALHMPREVAFLELHLGALALGATTLPLNERYPAPELAYYLTDAGARLAVVREEVHAELADELDACALLPPRDLRAELDAADSLDPDPDVQPSTPAVLCYTSGTTGKPKGALISHRALEATVTALHEAWRWSSDDVLVHALPLTHIHGLFVAQHGALYAGATAVWLPQFDARAVLEALERWQATVFMGVPTYYARLLALRDAPAIPDSMRLFTSGSAPLSQRAHHAFHERFGHAILERYGMTEVGIVLSNPYDGPRIAGAVGYPLAGVRTRVVDRDTHQDVPPGHIGELLIASASMFSGYLGRREQTADALRDGWMHTGDLATCEDGLHRIVGRARDLVICGGLNVYPGEVEAVLAQHPDVVELAVFGVPDDDLGERPVAAVVTTPSGIDRDALIAWGRARLAAYKLPREIRLVDALPRNTMGKVQKSVLRSEWTAPVVRDARASDARTLARWASALAWESEALELEPETVLEGVQAVLRDPTRGRYLIAELAGTPAGGLLLVREWSDWRARFVWWIHSVYVDQGARRRGVYRALYDDVLRRARAEGVAGVRLYVDRRNTVAIDTYRALGMDGDHYRVFEQMLAGPSGYPPTR
jgi:malonyl-CoA/methylmalonyl-CoA synthetase